MKCREAEDLLEACGASAEAYGLAVDARVLNGSLEEPLSSRCDSSTRSSESPPEAPSVHRQLLFLFWHLQQNPSPNQREITQANLRQFAHRASAPARVRALLHRP
jgi:hypothetical protein